MYGLGVSRLNVAHCVGQRTWCLSLPGGRDFKGAAVTGCTQMFSYGKPGKMMLGWFCLMILCHD